MKFDDTPEKLPKLEDDNALEDIDEFIDTVLLGYPPKNIWDDVWMTGETDDTGKEAPG
jgi:hypothetical protein